MKWYETKLYSTLEPFIVFGIILGLGFLVVPGARFLYRIPGALLLTMLLYMGGGKK